MSSAGTRTASGAGVPIKQLMYAGVEGDCLVVPAGETLLRMPEHLIITLEGVFEDEVSSILRLRLDDLASVLWHAFRVTGQHVACVCLLHAACT